MKFFALAALAATAYAGQCKVELHENHTQGVGNPGGTNTSNFTYGIKFTYADGHTTEYQPSSAAPYGGDCFSSELPYQVCVTSNQQLKDGYMNYADQHADFHSEYCTGHHSVGPFHATNSVECHFDC